MTKYIVMEHPVLGKKVIKKGFYFWGFIFGPLWMLYHGMWVRFLVILICLRGAHLLYSATSVEASIHITIGLLLGIYGGSLLQKKYIDKGYCVVKEVVSQSAESALAEAYRKQVE